MEIGDDFPVDEQTRSAGQGMEFLHALNTAAASLQRSARSTVDVFQAFTQQVAPLNLLGMIGLLEPDADTLVVRALVFPTHLREQHPGISEISRESLHIPTPGFEIVQRILESGKGVFGRDNRLLISQIAPKDDPSLKETLLQKYGDLPSVYAPIFSESSVQGICMLAGGHLTAQDLPALEAFANQVSAAIEITRLLETENQRRKEAETLRQATIALTSILDLDQVLQSILTHIEKVVPYDSAAVFLLKENGLRGVAGKGFPDPTLVIHQTFPNDGGLFEQLRSARQPIILKDAQENPDFQRWAGTDYVHSWLGVPLIVQDQVIGYLTCDNHKFAFYTETHASLAQTFANQAAIAIENALLFEAEREERKQAEILREVAQAVNSSLDLNQVLHLILEQLKRLLTFDTSSVLLFEERGKPVLVASIGMKDESLTRQVTEERLIDSPILKKMAEDLQPVSSTDVRQQEGWIWLEGAEQVRSFLCVPILIRQKMIGALMVDSHNTGHFNQENVRTVSLLAQHMAVAIENARLFEAEGQRVAELEAVRQASLSLTASLETRQLLDEILKATLSLLKDAQNSHIFLYEPEGDGRLIFGAALWADNPKRYPWSEPRQNGLTYTVARQGQPIIVPDMRDHPLYRGTPEDWEGAIVGLPLKIGQRVVGVMNVSYPQPRQFSEAELRVLRLLGDQAAIAIENARLFEQAATERRHLGLLYDVGRELAGSLDPYEIMSRALTLTCQALGGMVGEGLIYVPEGDRLVITALYGLTDVNLDELNARLQLTLGQGISGWAALQRQAIIVNDLSQDEHWMCVPGVDDDVKSSISAPILAGERLLGVMTVLHRQSGFFREDHLNLIDAISQELGLALSNASRYQQVERRLNEMTLIQDLARSFNQRLEVRKLLEEVVTQLANRFGYSQVRIFLIENNQLVVKAFHGPHPPYEVYDLDRGIIGRVARTGEPAFVPDVRQDQDYQACFVESIAELAVPIYREQAVVGVINVESERFEQLTEQDRILLELLAGQISVALENAVLYEHIRLHAEELEHTVERRTSELTALYKLSQEIGYNLSYEELLKLLLHHLHNAIDAELVGGCLIINDSRSFFIETNRPAAPEVLDEIRQMWQSLFLQIGKKPPEFKQIRVKTVPSGDYDENRAPIQEISSRLQAPIYSGQEITGLLIAADERQEAFGAEQERLLTTFANQATTALQRLSAILSAQQKHLENLVEHVPVGILLLDADFNLLIANPLGREFLSVINGDDFEGPLTRLGSFPLQELSAHHVEPFPIEISVPGPPRRIFAVQTRRIQESKSQWILTLHEVTRERENQARIQSQERLATVGQLAAGIAHDFNNIMAAILVYADLLHQDPNIQYSSREKLNIIQQQVQRASSLIRQILDFSRRSIMEQSALDLLPFIKELDKLLGRIMPESIRLELTYLPGNYWVNADPTRLQQVFMNLALNARDAMPKGGLLRFDLGRVEVGSTKKAPLPEMSPGDWIRVSISDNGVGIPADVQQYIFDPFFTTKPMGQGTGLGLAQVYGIIKQHGGFIEVSSHSGEGATFIIYLPALPPPKPKTGEFDSGANVFGNEEMVLVVEDNDATREALEALLEARNYRVLTACNGIEALERFEQKDGQISLVISDVVMPQMGGVALYGALRERWNHVPMLFITGHPMEVENQALLETGNVHWLQKPFSVQDLNHAIQELLNGGKRSD